MNVRVCGNMVTQRRTRGCWYVTLHCARLEIPSSTDVLFVSRTCVRIAKRGYCWRLEKSAGVDLQRVGLYEL